MGVRSITGLVILVMLISSVIYAPFLFPVATVEGKLYGFYYRIYVKEFRYVLGKITPLTYNSTTSLINLVNGMHNYLWWIIIQKEKVKIHNITLNLVAVPNSMNITLIQNVTFTENGVYYDYKKINETFKERMLMYHNDSYNLWKKTVFRHYKYMYSRIFTQIIKYSNITVIHGIKPEVLRRINVTVNMAMHNAEDLRDEYITNFTRYVTYGLFHYPKYGVTMLFILITHNLGRNVTIRFIPSKITESIQYYDNKTNTYVWFNKTWNRTIIKYYDADDGVGRPDILIYMLPLPSRNTSHYLDDWVYPTDTPDPAGGDANLYWFTRWFTYNASWYLYYNKTLGAVQLKVLWEDKRYGGWFQPLNALSGHPLRMTYKPETGLVVRFLDTGETVRILPPLTTSSTPSTSEGNGNNNPSSGGTSTPAPPTTGETISPGGKPGTGNGAGNGQEGLSGKIFWGIIVAVAVVVGALVALVKTKKTR